ncbi:MAG TPA: biopolymer transporter ExbD [Kofleriaceae bacterium]|nr:biopolymer transporter ExbD [Kofleriaceae bacterium]
MAHSLGTGRKGQNLEINIVPFIDVMSCLTAFLMFTAMWVQNAQLDTKPAGAKVDKPQKPPEKLGVLLEADKIVLLADTEQRELPAGAWQDLGPTLHAMKHDDVAFVEIAAESTREHPVTYQTLVTAMDTTIAAGYPDVRITDPGMLVR